MNWSLFRRPPCSDLAEEMRLHIEERAEQLKREGLSPDEAERQARIAFGNPSLIEERSREVWQWPTLESIRADVRLALRQLRRSPGFAWTAIITMALAIGANAVVFSVFDAILLRPLHVSRPQSFYALQHGDQASGYLSYPNYLDLRNLNRSFEDLAAYNAVMVGFDTGNNPSSEWGEDVTGNYFDALGVQPYLGHFFHAADEHGPNSAPWVVLSHSFWHSRFQDDRRIVGRVVRLNGHPFTVIGVAPPQFNGTLLFFNPSFFVPMIDGPLLAGTDLDARGDDSVFEVVGHLRPGVTPAQAVADLDRIGKSLQKSYPKAVPKLTFALTRPSLYGDYLGRPVRAFMAGLLLLTALILLAACANLGSLFAARASDRSREVALRLALGSTRKRILRGLFTEAILIALAGGAVGLLGSVMLLRALSAWRPIPTFPIQLAVNPDVKVCVAALLLAIVSGMLFGAVPVRQVLRTNPWEAVKAPAGGMSRRMSAREVLVMLQTAVCGVLVMSSLVAVRGLERSLHAHFGFDIRHTLVAEMDLSTAGYSGDRAAAMQKRMLDAVQALSGIESAGLTDALPLSVNGGDDQFVFAEQVSDLRPSTAAGEVRTYRISPGYLRAAGTALLFGRAFTSHDDKGSPRVAIVNQEFARKLYGSPAAAIGRWYKLRDGTRVQVVGVAEDGKYDSLTENPRMAMFFPMLQSPSTSTIVVVRARAGSSSPAVLAASLRKALRQLDAELPMTIETRDKPLDSTLFGPRIATLSLGVLGLIGAILSITGIFGIAAYSVSRRLKEFGIRIALGAQRRQLLQSALGRAFTLLAIGSAVGVLLGLLAARMLAYIVYQATSRDPLVVAGVVLTMAVLGLAATWIPAQRALSANPILLLRED